ncbi:hypothetical protein KR093_003363 [Drosophila rubida]|uniref:NTF2-related export protein n=1 Tax=Drosophila rubida TaxID=30044 RepID=A0AAD4JSL3_9MUSC|nr:hypothetical protein KR093_003363 [Drosophila rubida]
MTLNPQYVMVGKEFVPQYYAMFDDPLKRAELQKLYSPTDSYMTFEGDQVQGAAKIIEKVLGLSIQKISRVITTIDSQPTIDGGILVNVMGRLQCDEDPTHSFSQVFLLKPKAGAFYIAHDVFRLGLHNTA